MASPRHSKQTWLCYRLAHKLSFSIEKLAKFDMFYDTFQGYYCRLSQLQGCVATK